MNVSARVCDHEAQLWRSSSAAAARNRRNAVAKRAVKTVNICATFGRNA